MRVEGSRILTSDFSCGDGGCLDVILVVVEDEAELLLLPRPPLSSTVDVFDVTAGVCLSIFAFLVESEAVEKSSTLELFLPKY